MSTEEKTGIQTSIGRLLRYKIIEKVHKGHSLSEAARSLGIDPSIARYWRRTSRWFRKGLRKRRS